MVRVRVGLGRLLGLCASVGLLACPAEEDSAGGDTDGATDTDGTGNVTPDDEDDGTPPDPSGTSEAPDPSGSSGEPSDESSGGDDESSGGPVVPPDDCEIGVTPANEVVMIGDSYLAITTVPLNLMVAARLNGSLGPQDEYRRYDVAGTQMGNGQIPGQFDQALSADPAISTVIMDGGGNDVLVGAANICLSQPPPGGEACVNAINNTLGAAETLLADMANAGVQDVVYFFYPHLPENAFPQGAKNETLDYAAPLVEEVCANAPLDCHFVDIRDAFEGHPEYISLDGIHPTDAGSEVIAELLWETMVENCVAQ